ncbi:MAG: hypothetical protein JO128_15450 [Alphaproteobacteria bacterium]|nr:hypothetical protein [Alphaproteobacteria bacterium]
MTEFTYQGASGRFEDRDADLREEIRLMALAQQERASQATDGQQRSLLSRLFSRPSARLAA